MLKKIRKLTSLFMAAILVCSGCAGSGSDDGKKAAVKALPKYEELSSLVGLTKEAVLEKQQWQAADLTDLGTGTYTTPLQVEYEGVEFKTLQLGFDVYSEKLSTLTYLAKFTGDAEAAKKAFLAVAGRLKKELGKPDSTLDDISELTEDSIDKLLTGNKNDEIQYFWDMTAVATEENAVYIQQLNKDEANYGKLIPFLYSLKLSLGYSAETQTAVISIRYGAIAKLRFGP